MALNEEHTDQTRQKWFSRFAQERHKLSASVEETLIENESQKNSRRDELEEQGHHDEAERGPSLISPRITLQSRPMPVVRPDGLSRSSRALVPANVALEPRSSSTMQNTGVLQRIAQRISASFAVFGSIMQPDALPHLPPPTENEDQELSRMREASLLPPTLEVETSLTAGITKAPERRVINEMHLENSAVEAAKFLSETRVISEAPPEDVVVEAIQVLAAQKVTQQPKLVQPTETAPAKPLTRMVKSLTSAKSSSKAPRKPRLAGHTTKIHLENASVSAEKAVARQTDMLHLDRVEEAIRKTEGLSENIHSKGENTSAHLPSVGMIAGGVGSLRGGLSGSGIFEVGHSEVTIANKRITASCVVQVMLTQNPGPVVIHYVSLRPQESFTVHLTAAATSKASFNYVILLGELF